MRETTEMWIQERERDEQRGRETEKERGGREGRKKKDWSFFFCPFCERLAPSGDSLLSFYVKTPLNIFA